MSHPHAKLRPSQGLKHRPRQFGASCNLAGLLVVLGVVLASDVLLTGGSELVLPVASLVLSYPTRFLAFYEPKVLTVLTFVNEAVEEYDISEQVSDAWDFTVALFTLVCVHQVIEAARTSVACRLRPSNLKQSTVGT
ncbi:hypothetical protein KRP22_001167 [Phytophthora ramorum]|nr:hypothetical protein KRP22_96 [Phytophthora ramorum]